MSTAAYILADRDVAYSPQTQAELAEILDILPIRMTGGEAPGRLAELRDVQIVLSGWGSPRLDAGFMEAVPRLEGVFYAAGSVREMVTDAFWKRDIPICSAWSANAIPVAEFVLAQIILCLKHAHSRARATRVARTFVNADAAPGSYDSKVGIIGLGMIGRLVVEMLRVLKVEVWAVDPFLPAGEAAVLGVRPASLEEVFRECDAVSLHAPSLESTRGMITGEHFRAMKRGASFINTARGAVVREAEMIDVLQARPDIFAALDVTAPEPPVADSPLYTLPNVLLTPHIAGSLGRECWRMGECMLEEVRRHVAGEPLLWRVSEKMSATLA